MSFIHLNRSLVLLTLLSVILNVQGQAPQGYYDSTKGASGKALKTAMHKVITHHQQIGYDGLWKAYQTTDRRSDGCVWDIYSNTTNYRFGTDQDKGHHSQEGDTYNREHTIPQSWFDRQEPIRSDVFHVYPSDSYVNGMRSSYPFGETDYPSWTSDNSFSKLGDCSVNGYSGTVFEPNDEYKGDIARTYFYMATCYENQWRSFHDNKNGAVISRDSYKCYTSWTLDMLLRWAHEDPVSQKEIDRNNAAYEVQENRNPFIDFPGLEQYVWGSKTTTAFDPDNYEGGVTPDPDPQPQPGTISMPTFSPASGIVARGTEITITTATQGATIHYTLNDAAESVGQSPVKFKVSTHTTVTAYAVVGDEQSQTASATYSIREDLPDGGNVYSLVTDLSQLVNGQNVLIVGDDHEGHSAAMSHFADNHRKTTAVTVNGEHKIQTETGQQDQPYTFTVSGDGQIWHFFSTVENCYLSLKSNGNQLHNSETDTEPQSQWMITIDQDAYAYIQNVKYKERFINYNAGASRFACYKSSSNQFPVSLYAHMTSTGIHEINHTAQDIVRVYDLNGRLVRQHRTAEEALRGLPDGIYLINGQKILIR